MSKNLHYNLNKKISLPARPEIFNIAKTTDAKKLQKLFSQKKMLSVIDDYPEQLKELFAIQNPTLVYTPDFGKHLQTFIKNLETKTPLRLRGRWVYFPWNGSLVHILEDKDFQTVRTARNRYLIDENEQKKILQLCCRYWRIERGQQCNIGSCAARWR
jgi:hypothetical protein